jgi:polysaccharide pyruvyl transferase WcaK-like protein
VEEDQVNNENDTKEVVVAITAASFSGNKGAAAMLMSSIQQLYDRYGEKLRIHLMSVYPLADQAQLPYPFIRVISAKPEQLIFVAFPLAVLYRLLRWLAPMKKLIEHNRIIRAYRATDLVVDEAGIAFVDSRGMVMNTYAFICAAVPLLVGTPVVKYSQAMGTFKNPYNRFLAKWILPKLRLIHARGQTTLDNLKAIGITDNVQLCADGAFTMADSGGYDTKVAKRCEADDFYNDSVIALSISSVVQKKCSRLGIDYQAVMADFIQYLNEQGYGVLLIANAARLGSSKSRNNDLLVGDAIFERLADKAGVRWYHEEMAAEEIRSYISRCRFLVASRFHAMIGALEKEVPVLLIGWSHKYQEVLDMFELGQYAADFSNLNLAELKRSFEVFAADEAIIREKIKSHREKVLDSSRDNIRHISAILDEICRHPSS